MPAVLTPDSGAPIFPTSPVAFSVTDTAETLTSLLIGILHQDGTTELIHDGTNFTAPYAGSTRSSITNGYHFSVTRVGGWVDTNVVLAAYPFAGSTGTGINWSTDFSTISDPPDIDVSLSATGVATGSHGDASHVAQVAFDAKGRALSVANISIAIASSAITDASTAGKVVLTAADAAAQRTALGLVIGTNVQAHDAELDALAGVTSAADTVPYFTGSGAASVAAFTAAGRTLVGGANAAAQRTSLGLVIGTDVQAHDADLDALASVTSAADKVPYFTGAGTATTADFTSTGRAVVGAASASAARTALGVAIGTDVQAHDAELDALASVTSAADTVPYFTGSGAATTTALTSAGRTLIGGANAAAQRTSLGLVIGTNVEAWSANLDALSGVTSAADTLAYFTGSGTAGTTALTSAGRTLIGGANAAAQRTTLGLVIGTDVQAHDAELDALAGLTSAADKVPYFTGSGTAATADFTSAARTLVAASSASAQRTAIGLGTIATFDASTIAITDVPTIKSYVDSIGGGASWKASVRAATTTAGTLATSFANGQTIDGVTLATADRIAILNQASGSENGIYTVNASGAPTRATDANTGALMLQAAFFVREGTTNQDKAFVCTNDSITLGTTALTFVNFNSVAGALVASNNLSDVSSASTARTNLGLAIGTDVQAQDAELSALAGLTSAADTVPYFTGSGTAATAAFTSTGRAIVAAASTSAARTALGLAIGTDVQAYDAELAALAGLTSAADALPYFTGSGTASTATFTSAARTLLAAVSASAQRTTLGLVIGTDVQAHDAELDALAGLTSAADKVPYFTGSGTAATADFTATGRAIVGAASASAARTALGVAIGSNVEAWSANLDALSGVTSAADKVPYFTGSGAATVASLTSAGRTVIGGTSLAAILDSISLQSSNLASASTTDLSTMTGDYGHITGTTTINSFGTCAAGVTRVLVFDGALTITYNATSMILPGSVSLNTVAGDVITFISEGSGNWRLAGRVTITQQSIVGGSTLTGQVLSGDNVTVTGLSAALILEDAVGSYQELYGLAGGTDGKLIVIRNTSSAANPNTALNIMSETTSSSAANRFKSPGAYILGGQCALFRYNGTSSRWEIIAAPANQSSLDNTTGSGSGANGDGGVQFGGYGGRGNFQTANFLFGCSPWNILQEGQFDNLIGGGFRTVRRIQMIKGSDVASANDITLPGWVSSNPSAAANAGAGNTHAVTGTTTINRILAGDKTAGGWQAGSKITLLFSTVLTLHDGATAGSNFYGLKLRGGTDRETIADMALELVFDGSWWVER